MNREVPKRLAPTIDTLRELFLKSGNLCAYPGCHHLMMDVDGVFVGQICHIEAAEPGGQRFNPNMTNEERRKFSNLMLMCHAHHKITDSVILYSASKLQRIKADHEAQYTNPETLMLESIRDWTAGSSVTYPSTLTAFLGAFNQKLDKKELNEVLGNFRAYIDNYRNIPVQVRNFLSAVVVRIQKMEGTGVVVNTGWSERGIFATDLESAFRLTADQVADYARQLERYGVASIREVEDENFRIDYIFALHEVEDWPFWSDVGRFCELMDINVSRFAVDMQFAELD